MKDIKSYVIGFLTCACMFLIMGQTNYHQTKYEFGVDTRPWHLIQSPVKEEVFVVLGGTTGHGGVACLTYSENDEGIIIFELKWRTPTSEYNVLHGITIDALGENIYVSGRGDHKLYKFDAETGVLLDSKSLGYSGQVIAPAGLSIMQNN